MAFLFTEAKWILREALPTPLSPVLPLRFSLSDRHRLRFDCFFSFSLYLTFDFQLGFGPLNKLFPVALSSSAAFSSFLLFLFGFRKINGFPYLRHSAYNNCIKHPFKSEVGGRVRRWSEGKSRNSSISNLFKFHLDQWWWWFVRFPCLFSPPFPDAVMAVKTNFHLAGPANRRWSEKSGNFFN